MTWASTAVWTGLLASLHAGTSDFALRPERWENAGRPGLRREHPSSSPLPGPAAVDALAARVADAPLLRGLDRRRLRVPRSDSLRSPCAVSAKRPRRPDFLENSSRPVEISRRAVDRRAGTNKRAVASLTPDGEPLACLPLRRGDQQSILSPRSTARISTPPSASTWLARPRPESRRSGRHRRRRRRVIEKIVRHRALRSTAVGTPPSGKIIISPSGDVEFGPEESASAGLIVRLGGRHALPGTAAAAGEGQISLSSSISAARSSSRA